MSDRKTKTVIDKAFEDLADEFSQNAKGAGESLGKSAKFVAKAVEVVVTSPLLIPKGYQTIVEKIKPKVDEKVGQIPDEKLVEPDLSIAGPALEAMRFTIDEDEIAEMFASLLACSMHADLKPRTHHSFVEVLKQLSPGEARMLKLLKENGDWAVVDLKAVAPKTTHYSVMIRNASHIGKACGVDNPATVQVYIDNLCRLGLCEMPPGAYLIDSSMYVSIENDELMKPHIDKIKSAGREPKFERKYLTLNQFGKAFCVACMIDDASLQKA